MSSPPNLSQILAQAQKIQAKMGELQRELAVRRFEGSAGGGMVTAVVSGELRVLEVRIESALIEGRDRDMIQDLTAAAVNVALDSAQRGVREEMQRVTGGLALPGLDGFGTPSQQT
jgi:DNA-binding YbaB/EbfC family protein